MTSPNPVPRGERRAGTERALLTALVDLMLAGGFDTVRVETVARQAGVNKALVYRYFGGIEGMVEALASDPEFVPDLAELCGGDIAGVRALPPRERLVRLVQGYGRALRTRPVMGFLMVNALVSDAPVLRKFLRARGEELRAMLRRLDLTSASVGLDLEALLHLVWAAIVVRAASDRREDSPVPAWERMEAVLVRLLRAEDILPAAAGAPITDGAAPTAPTADAGGA